VTRIFSSASHRVPYASAIVSLTAAALLQLVPARALADGGSVQADAQALVDRAYEEHAAGRYVEAVGSYLKAYELTKTTAILYNVAIIYDRSLHEPGLATEYYRRYVEARDATPDLVQRATERIAMLKKEIEEEEAKKVTELAAPPAPAETSQAATPALAPPNAAPVPAPSAEAPAAASAGSGGSGLRTVGLVLGGVGLAGIGTSMALGLIAKNKDDEANITCGPATCSTRQGFTAEHDAVSFATAATVTFIAGAAILASGVTLYVVAPRSRGTPSLMLAPQVATRAAGVALYARF
jgi:hypothetical protein